jgi:hypothetical protein
MFQVRSALLCMALASILTLLSPLANIGGEYPLAWGKNGGGKGGGNSGKGGESAKGGHNKGTSKPAKGLRSSHDSTSNQVSKSRKAAARRKVEEAVEPSSKARPISGKGRRTHPEITGSLPANPSAIAEMPFSAELISAQKQLSSAQLAFNAALADPLADLTKLEQAISKAELAVIEAGSKLATADLPN